MNPVEWAHWPVPARHPPTKPRPAGQPNTPAPRHSLWPAVAYRGRANVPVLLRRRCRSATRISPTGRLAPPIWKAARQAESQSQSDVSDTSRKSISIQREIHPPKPPSPRDSQPEFGLMTGTNHTRVEPRNTQNTRKQKDSLASLVRARLLSVVVPEGSPDESTRDLLLFRVFRVFRGKNHSAYPELRFAGVPLCGCQTGRLEAACRRAASSAMAARSPPKRSEISRRMRWISSMGDSVFEFWIIAKHLFRGTNDGDRDSQLCQNTMNAEECLRIRNVPAIPCQEVFYPMVGH